VGCVDVVVEAVVDFRVVVPVLRAELPRGPVLSVLVAMVSLSPLPVFGSKGYYF
jgi:hypothetical protein